MLDAKRTERSRGRGRRSSPALSSRPLQAPHTSAWKLRFSFVPQRAYQGQSAAVSVLVKPAHARCTLAVRFADGSSQPGLTAVRAAQGKAAWTWSLAQSAVPGPAKATVSCGRSGTLSRTFTVVGGTVVSTRSS